MSVFRITEVGRLKYHKYILDLRFPWPNFGSDGDQNYVWGYIEIFHEREWGSICERGFDDRDANVTCKTAGFKGEYKNCYLSATENSWSSKPWHGWSQA